MSFTRIKSQLHPLQQGLKLLADKYAVTLPTDWHLSHSLQSPANTRMLMLPGWAVCDQLSPSSDIHPLLPWQEERRFVELRQIVQQGTIEHVSMWRSRWLVPDGTLTLPQAIYREAGICQWVLDSPATSVFATIRGTSAANVILRLENGVTCGIEIGRAPADAPATVDRHEIIAQRGVASDQVVDCEVRPSSIYVMTDSAAKTYTDVDHELFGLNEQQAAIVHTAFTALKTLDAFTADRTIHEQLAHLTALAIESDRSQQRLDVLTIGGVV